MKFFKLAFIAVLISFVLIGCKDAQDISPLTSQSEPSLSAEQYSPQYSVKEAVEIFKSGDNEAIQRVLMSRKSVRWDGKSEFKKRVQYTIPKDLIEKARNMSEDFRRMNDMDREFQRTGELPQGGKKIKKKSSSPGLSGVSGVSANAFTVCQAGFGLANAIATVETQMCYCGANAYCRIGQDNVDWAHDAGFGKFIYAGAMVVGYSGGGVFALCEGFGCLGGEMDAHSCFLI